MSDYQYAVAVGNPFSGIALYGPFVSEDEALRWAEREIKNDPWTVTEMEAP